MADLPRSINRELSWLAFNGRVLQEAMDSTVPLLERLKFLAIFSSNLDEFFRVRVASLRSLLRLKKKARKQLDINPERLLKQIHTIVIRQQEAFGEIYRQHILPALEQQGIILLDENALTASQQAYCTTYFAEQVRPYIHPIVLAHEETGLSLDKATPFLTNHALYLAVELWPKAIHYVFEAEPQYALVEIPTNKVPRFVKLPGDGTTHPVVFLDDLIRHQAHTLFEDYEVGAVHAVKVNRDAELYLEDEYAGDLVEMIRSSLKKRDTGRPTRFLYDLRTPYAMVTRLKDLLHLADEDMVVGGRYHNFTDFFGFPDFGRTDLLFPPQPPHPHPVLSTTDAVMDCMRAQDHLLSYPYQAFTPVLRFLEEAAADPAVTHIRATLYRVASNSSVTQALIRAAQAGKHVVAFVEVKARFDEAANLHWARAMEQAGVQVLYSMPGIKVHAKALIVTRQDDDGPRHYAVLSTGNFNEKTARIYADHALFTADERLTTEMLRVFDFLLDQDQTPSFEHLLVAPFTMREAFVACINREIAHAQAGCDAWMVCKMNSLEDDDMIEHLYRASQAGVRVKLIIRGICCLNPGVPGLSENIEVRSIVGRYLEHARIYQFGNGGEEEVFLASADWMRRNLSRRVEVAFPVLDPSLCDEIRMFMRMQLADTTKARVIDARGVNAYVEAGEPARNAQEEAYSWYAEHAAAGVRAALI